MNKIRSCFFYLVASLTCDLPMFEKKYFLHIQSLIKKTHFTYTKVATHFFTYVRNNKMRPSYVFEFFKGIRIHDQYAHTKFWQKKLILFRAIKIQNSDSL
jgi:hypothetical protein